MIKDELLRFWLTIVILVIGMIISLVVIDNHITMSMAGRELCYTHVSRVNDNSSWEWKKCQ